VYGTLGRKIRHSAKQHAYAPNSPYSASSSIRSSGSRLSPYLWHASLNDELLEYFGTLSFSGKTDSADYFARAGKDLPVYGDGRYDWLFVTDHCAAITASLKMDAWAKPTTSDWNEQTNLSRCLPGAI
jgi:dTDP-glucose 4,6-dehydratase